MKILITTEWFAPVVNGVVTSVINLQNELLKSGHDVRVLTLSGNKNSFQKDGVTYISSLGAGKIYPGARLAFSADENYLEELIDWNPDIIHSQCEFSTFHMAKRISKRLGIPLVHTYHTVYEDYTHYFSPNKKWGKAVVAMFTKRVLRFTDRVIVPTDKVRSLLIEYGVKQRINVVPTGVDLDMFDGTVENEDIEMLKKKVGIPPENYVLISVGRLAKEKNLEEILMFMTQIERENITLLVVGDGPHRQELEEYVKRLGITDKVIFSGMVDPREICLYYKLGDVFVSGSNSETQGLTYIEALANGVPALCRRDPCLLSVIEDGINGWQYESYEQFSDRLAMILDKRDRYEYLSNNARNSIKSKYSSAAFGKKIENIYHETLDEYKNNINPAVVLVQ